MTDIWRMSASAVAEAIRGRQFSAVEAAKAAIDRLNAVNPVLNAVVEHRPDEVLAQARVCDERLARGEDLGPLGGVPITIKVNVDQVGYATSNGVTLQKDVIATRNSPVVDNFLKAGAVVLGRTNTPAFSLRWFTDNKLCGATRNPRNAQLTPGGSSGGAASSVAAGIGHIAHGTDIAGSIRYPAYACGVHGLRPSLGRVPAFNAALPERGLGGQITAVSGPLARHIADIRLALQVLAAPDARDPWYVPVPFAGAAVPRRAALWLRPDGMEIAPEVEHALHDAAARLRDAGWQVDEVDSAAPLREAAHLQMSLWLGDGYAGMLAAAEREGDEGALTALRGQREVVDSLDLPAYQTTLTRRATLVRDWHLFFERYPLLLTPSSAELPFADGLDLQSPESYRRVWEAQIPQIAVPFMGLPGLAVATGESGGAPLGVQLLAARYREDVLLDAAEAIEARGLALTIAEPGR